MQKAKRSRFPLRLTLYAHEITRTLMAKNLAKWYREMVNGPHLKIFSYILIPDAMAIALSAVTAYKASFENERNFVATSLKSAQFEYRGILFLVVVAWLLVLIFTGTYRFKHTTLVVFNLRLIIKRSISFFFFLGFLSYILKASFSRSVFIVMLSSGLIYLFVLRLCVHIFVMRPKILRKKIASNLMIVGRSKSEMEEYSDWLISHRKLGFKVVSRQICIEINKTWIDEFESLVYHKNITEVLVLPGLESDPNFSKFIHFCEDLNIHVNWIPLDSGNLGYWLIPSVQDGIPFLTFEKSDISLPWRIVKRSFDLGFSIATMVFLSPLFLGISIVVLVSSGRPIFYSQTRIGKNGKPFKFFKFRSMVKGAENLIAVQLSTSSSTRDSSKRADDFRITREGRFLRKYSLDELPQFLNVFLGSMSVVGPRPAVSREVNQYSSIYERRLNAKPGITGPWQISGRSDLDLSTSVALDLNYLTNWSFTRDLWIIIATVGVIFKGKGAY